MHWGLIDKRAQKRGEELWIQRGFQGGREGKPRPKEGYS